LVHRAADSPDESEAVLEVRDLQVTRGRSVIIGDSEAGCRLTFRLNRGEIGILEAPNGWGKTTLFEAVAGLLLPEQGTILVNGRDLTRDDASHRTRGGVSLLRATSRMFASLTVRDRFALAGLSVPPSLERLARQRMDSLSGGEEHAVSLECTFAMPRSLYLLDEPFAALDDGHIADTNDRIRNLSARLATAVLIAVPAPVQIEPPIEVIEETSR
jgi:ABC-type lipopolysaccharide export system ATPase subunit